MFKYLSYTGGITSHRRFTTLLLMACMAVILCGPVSAQDNDNFNCGDGGGGSADIFAWAAFFNANQDLVVQVVLCDSVDESIKYRLHIDHTAPFFDEVDKARWKRVGLARNLGSLRKL